MKKRKQATGMHYTIFSVAATVSVLIFLDIADPNIKMIDNLYDNFFGNQEPIAEEIEKAEVVRVVDGDTVVVSIAGREEKVRLIGVDAPESVGQYREEPEAYGVAASEFMNALLDRSTVYLEKDEEDADRYGRKLRYVWTDVPDYDHMKERMVNFKLLNEGMATTMFIEPNKKYQKEFKEEEEEAKAAGIGIWSE